jgi:hypothetical protein
VPTKSERRRRTLASGRIVGWQASPVLDFVIGRGCSTSHKSNEPTRLLLSFGTNCPPNLRQAKSTRRNRLGDAYQPNPASSCADPFDATQYHPPMIGHSHRESGSDETWKNDIEFYNCKFKRHSAYIVAKPCLTFLWQTPTLYLKDHPRNQSWDSVDDLLRRLIAAR